MIKHVAMALTVGSLLIAGNAWAEGCMYQYSKEAKMAAAHMDEAGQPLVASIDDPKQQLLWQIRGLDDAKRSRLIGRAPIESIVPIHN